MPQWPPLHCAGCGLLQRDNPGEGSSRSFASLFVSAPQLGSASPQQGCTSSEPFSNSSTSTSKHSSLMASTHLEAICACDEMHALCVGRWEFGRGGCCTHTHARTRTRTHTHAHHPWDLAPGVMLPASPRCRDQPCTFIISILSVSRAAQTNTAQDLLLCLTTSFIGSWEKQ